MGSPIGVGGSTVIPGISIRPKQNLRDGVGVGPVRLQSFPGFQGIRFAKVKGDGAAGRRTEVEGRHGCHSFFVTTLESQKSAAASCPVQCGGKEGMRGDITGVGVSGGGTLISK